MEKATGFVSRGDLPAALQVVEEVRRLPEDEAYAHELRGTILALVKDYAGAEASFRAMVKKIDDSPIGNFNVAEMVMLQGRYTEAEERFRFVEDQNRASDPALADLCRFKRVVCLSASLQIPEAERLLAPINDPSLGSPGAQYARAVVYCAKNQYDKAAQVIANARNEFPHEVENLFVDSLVEMHWGKRDEHDLFVAGPQEGPRPGGGPASGTVVAEYPAGQKR